jgi:hypothetical protein
MNEHLWIYQIGDSREPGSYTSVGGLDLVDEGSATVASVEQFRIDAADLVNANPDARYALVRVEDDSRQVIETYP